MQNCYLKGILMPKSDTQLLQFEVVCSSFTLPSWKENCFNQNVCCAPHFLDAQLKMPVAWLGDALKAADYHWHYRVEAYKVPQKCYKKNQATRVTKQAFQMRGSWWPGCCSYKTKAEKFKQHKTAVRVCFLSYYPIPPCSWPCWDSKWALQCL